MSESIATVDEPVVLVVDDDDTTRMMATGFLSQAGFKVVEAESGAVAIDSCKQEKPDLIVLDVEMPGMDGFEVCTQVRGMAGFDHVPILMLTGLENDEYIDKAYDVGATDFASKPINWSLLCHRLRYLHRTSLSAIQIKKQQASLEEAQRIAQMGSWTIDLKTESLEWSDQLYNILGVDCCSVEPSFDNALDFVHPDDAERVESWFGYVLKSGEPSSIDHRVMLPDGTVRIVRQQVEPEIDNNSGEVVGLRAVVQDFTERRRVQEKVHQLAYYDTLTTLPNRILFQEQLSLAMKRAHAKQTQIAVLYFDLDDFKRVNDTFGHAVGDKLLLEVGNRLVDTLRISPVIHEMTKACDVIARMGGDEFIIILNDIISEQEVEGIAQRIINVVSEPYRVDEYELFTSPSIGIAIYPKDGLETDTLLKNADMAMYEAKRIGKNMYMVHNQDMEDKALRRYNIDAQMRSALENDEFSVNYQVQVDLNTGKLFSAEALVRWHSDNLGFVSPGEFIPVAEENGLIISIGEWVMHKACSQAKEWLDSGFPIAQVAVNISVMQFMRSDFVSVVKNTLNATNLPAECLELEITESLLAADINYAIRTLSELNELGVTLSIDDFGTGYSSLSQLKHFPIDRVKIDQSFIANVTENRDDAAITRAVIAMANSMDINVLAEGVETADHFNFLIENGCHEIQGYLISKPVSAEQLNDDIPTIVSTLDQLFDDADSQRIRLAS